MAEPSRAVYKTDWMYVRKVCPTFKERINKMGKLQDFLYNTAAWLEDIAQSLWQIFVFGLGIILILTLIGVVLVETLVGIKYIFEMIRGLL